MSTDKGGRVEKARRQGRRLPRRHVPALRGHGPRQRHRPHGALRRHQVAARGRPHRAGLLDGRLVRPAVRGHGPADGQAHRVVHGQAARHDALRAADQDQGRGHQPHLRGHHPQDPEVDALQGPRGDAAARAPLRRDGPSPSRPAPSATAPASPPRRWSSKIRGKNIADLCTMQISDLADVGARARRAVGRTAAQGPAAPARLVRPRSGWATSPSTGRPARSRAARPSAPR